MTADTFPRPVFEASCVMVFQNVEKGASNPVNKVLGGDAELHPEDSASSFESLNINNERDFSGPLHLSDAKKSVSFPYKIVSDVWERPKTLPEDRNTLFYTGAEIATFRREYRALVSIKIAQQKAKVLPSQGIVLPTTYTLSLILAFLQKATILAAGSLLKSSPQPVSSHCQTETVLLVDTLYLF